MRVGGHRGSVRVASTVTLLLLLAGCSTWRPAGPDDVAGAGAPSPSASSITASASPDEAGTPVAALRRLYAVVDRLDADPSEPVSRLDAVAVGPARDALASAVRHRRATGRGRPVPETELSQIVVRPSVRSEDTVSAALQFCANRQIDAGSQPDRQELRPTTLTFRYASGRWLAYTFGFDSADCGCSLPVQCG
jgi:hypothetical protein